MKAQLLRLKLRLWPWSTIEHLRTELDFYQRQVTVEINARNQLRSEAEMLRKEADTSKRQMRETVSVNHANAAHTRALEVAALMQNHRLQAAELRLAGKAVPQELADAAHDFRGVQLPIQPKQIESTT